MGIRSFLTSLVILVTLVGSADSGAVRAWQGRINIDIPLPVPAIELASANPFATQVDTIPRLTASTPPRKVDVAGSAIIAAYIDSEGDCGGAVPLEVPFPGLTRALLEGTSAGRFDPAMTGERPRPSWPVIEIRIEGTVKEATVISQELALPDPGNPPEPIQAALPPPAGHLLQLPAASWDELTSLAHPRRIKVRASSSEPVVSIQALVHINERGNCDQFVPIVLDSGLHRWLSGYLASWRMEPSLLNGQPVDAWVVYTARVKMKLSSLQAASFRVLADRHFSPS
jgi:hypothetical protein